MLLEMLSHALALDAGYFANLISGNLFWVFGFISAAYYFKGKSFWSTFFIIIFVIASMMDLQQVHNLAFYVGGALMMAMLGRVVVLAFLANLKGGERHMPLGYAIVTYSVLFYFNFFG